MVYEYNVAIKNRVYEIFNFIGRLLCMNEKSWTQNGVSWAQFVKIQYFIYSINFLFNKFCMSSVCQVEWWVWGYRIKQDMHDPCQH